MIIPQWLLISNKNGYLTMRDIVNLFGLSPSAINKKIDKGQFIKSDRRSIGLNERESPIRLWKVSEVIKFIKEENVKDETTTK